MVSFALITRMCASRLSRSLTLAICVLFASNVLSEEILSFGIVPQQSAQKLAAVWQPVFDLLEEQGVPNIKFKTAKNIPVFEERLVKGLYDLSYMNPYHFTVFNDSPGYQALVKAKDKKIKGIVLVHKDSAYKTLQDLEGLTLAFPAPAAFAASVLPQANLSSRGISFNTKYVQTHDSVYLTVSKGIYPAGGGVIRTFKAMPESVRNQLRILWTTPGYTPHAIAVHPRIGEALRNKIQRAFLSVGRSDAGKKALAKLKLKGFVSAQNNDWDDVRKLGITKIDVQSK